MRNQKKVHQIAVADREQADRRHALCLQQAQSLASQVAKISALAESSRSELAYVMETLSRMQVEAPPPVDLSCERSEIAGLRRELLDLQKLVEVNQKRLISVMH